MLMLCGNESLLMISDNHFFFLRDMSKYLTDSFRNCGSEMSLVKLKGQSSSIQKTMKYEHVWEKSHATENRRSVKCNFTQLLAEKPKVYEE